MVEDEGAYAAWTHFVHEGYRRFADSERSEENHE